MDAPAQATYPTFTATSDVPEVQIITFKTHVKRLGHLPMHTYAQVTYTETVMGPGAYDEQGKPKFFREQEREKLRLVRNGHVYCANCAYWAVVVPAEDGQAWEGPLAGMTPCPASRRQAIKDQRRFLDRQ